MGLGTVGRAIRRCPELCPSSSCCCGAGLIGVPMRVQWRCGAAGQQRGAKETCGDLGHPGGPQVWAQKVPSPGGRKSRGRWCAPSWGCRVNVLAGLGTVHLPVWLVFGTGQVLGSLSAHEIHLGPGFQRGVWGGLCTLGGLLPSHCASLLLCGLSHLTVHRESLAVPPLGSLFSAFCQQGFLPPGNCTWASCSRMACELFRQPG